MEGQSASANGRDVELKVSYTFNSNPVADDNVKVTICELIFASFGDGGVGQSNLGTYLTDTAGAIKNGDIYTDINASGKGFIVEIVNSEAGLKRALHTQDAHVVFDGHSNYGLGPAYSSSVTSISGFMNAGTTNVAVNYSGLRSQQSSFEIDGGEIAGEVENYTITGLNKTRFPNTAWADPPEGWPSLIEVTSGNNFPENYYRDDYEKMHYYATTATHADGNPSNTRLLVSAGSADLATLKYEVYYINGCYTDIYYYEPHNHGALFYTDDGASSTQTTKEFVKGIIEAQTWAQIKSALNALEDIHHYHEF